MERKEEEKMSKINLKRFIPISILAVLLVAVSAITYSIATNSNNNAAIGEKSISDVVQLGNSEPGFTYISNIDLIIENANDNNKTFNIVEIVPQGATNSDLKTYVDNAGFKNYVIDANSEKNATMKADMITYVCVSVNPTTALTDKVASHQVAVGTATTVGESKTMQNLLDEADLVYVSTPAYTSYDGDCNMSDEIYNYLRSYARGNDKPIIMDYVTKSTSVSTTENKTMGDLVNVVSKNHIRYRTFCWDKDVTAANFFARKGSYYLSFNTNKETATGKFLILSTNNTGSDILAKLKGMDADTDRTNLKAAAYSGTNTSSFSITDSSFTVMIVEDNKLLLDGTEVGASALDGYDFIIIEQDTPSIKISNDVYNKLKSLSESSTHILYDSRVLSSGYSDDSSDEVAVGANNYLNLMDYLISNKGVALCKNVLPVSYGYFTSLNIAGESGLSSAKDVANIIDGTNYRQNSGTEGGEGTAGSNRKVFRVLELQPCYPIDLTLAESKTSPTATQINQRFKDSDGNPIIKGDYYEEPSQVLSGVTSDEILEGTEYYAFELSKAKIAAATGLKMDQIEVDQMSTDQFISKKDVLVDTYDLIYIGGNKSALVPYTVRDYMPFYATDGNKNLDMYRLNTSFDMYTHTGTYVQLFTYYTNNGVTKLLYDEGAVKKGPDSTPWAYGTVFTSSTDSNGETTYTPQITSVALNGNDITEHKYNELKDYIDAGMPIIFEQTVAAAFEKTYKVRSNRLQQLALNDIDPDSYMYKILEYAYTSASSKTNIAWNLQMVDATTETTPFTTCAITEAPTTEATTEVAEAQIASLSTNSMDALGVGENDTEADTAENSDMESSDLDVLGAENDATEATETAESENGILAITESGDAESASSEQTATAETTTQTSTATGSSFTVKIDNSDKQYGNTITDEVTVFNSTINNKIYELVFDKSKVRPVLSIVSQPYDYEEGNTSTYNTGKTLKIEFYVTPVGENANNNYDVTLYVDKNENGIYSADESVGTKTYSYSVDSAGNPNTATISYNLGTDYFGMLSWKLVAKEHSSSSVATTGAAASGYPFYARGNAAKKDVRVLQLMPKNVKYTPETDSNCMEGYDKNDGHSLYLCTECQHASMPVKYNIYSNNLSQSEWNTYGHRQSVTLHNGDEGKENYSEVTLNFGLHEHKFGIVKYDTTISNEDWETNLSDVLLDDYDFNIDIMWAEDFDALVANSKELTEEQLTENQVRLDAAKAELAQAQATFNAQAPAIESSLTTLLNELKADGNYNNEDDFEQFAKDKEFYKFFYYNYKQDGSWVSAKFLEYVEKYNEYVAIKDPVLEAEEECKELERISMTAENWIKNNYSIVVLGYAEDFGGQDLSVDSCSLLKSYVSAGGYMLNTHDTTTRYAQMGAVNITTQLRSMFGMDRFHISNYNTYATTTTLNGLKTGMYLLSDTQNKDSAGNLLKDQRYATTSSKYFWTERIKIGDDYGNIAHSEWQIAMSNSTYGSCWKNNFGYTSPVGVTDATMIFETTSRNASPYKYVNYLTQDAIHWNQGRELATYNGKYYGTDGASRVNRGIVTEYPFTIRSFF